MAAPDSDEVQQLVEKILREPVLLQQLSDRVYELLQDDLRFQAERRVALKGDRVRKFL
jgi:hypothetical protein